MGEKWTAADMPDQTGRTAIVTGGNSGLGLETVRALAGAGAHVVLACRTIGKGEDAAREIRAGDAGADIEVSELDLASLDSVRAFAERMRAGHPHIDILINNAGVMAPPRGETVDGFELQFGTNHLGHFALTAQLIGAMAGSDPRVVTVSSSAHRFGSIAFNDLQRTHHYFRWRAYGQSKLANLLFAYELDRRLRAAGSPIKSVAAHPGYSATNLQFAAPPLIDRIFMTVSNKVIAQSAAMGALPQLYAATYPGLEGGTFVGPDGIGEQRGHPKLVSSSGASRDQKTARRLWEVSEELTGITFEIPAAVPD
jgi:NAD(P)-dependent dehydrogenase (short-subunit alcohol dehydrogenase family)